MTTFNIHEAKTHLSRLLERVEAGEEIVIAKAGKPIARLVAFHHEEAPRRPGLWKGQITIAPDFDHLPEDIEAAFRGESA